jgi:hypothetical protein
MTNKKPTDSKNDVLDAVRVKIVPDEEKLNAHPRTRQYLEGISDPIQRFIESSKIAEKYLLKGGYMKQLRQDRRIPIVALYRYFGWKSKAEIAKFIGARDSRVVYFSFALVDLRNIPERWRVDEKTPPELRKEIEQEVAQAAKDRTAEFAEGMAMGITAREVRRLLVLRLTNGMYGGRKWLNSELAELVGRTDSLMAQIRTGSANRKKKADRAAKRAASGRAA